MLRFVSTGLSDLDTRGPPPMTTSFPTNTFDKPDTKLAMIELKIVIMYMLCKFKLKKLPAAYAGFEAQDKNTHRPQILYCPLSPKVRSILPPSSLCQRELGQQDRRISLVGFLLNEVILQLQR